MIKVFISQPMKGKTDEEIKSERAATIEKIKEIERLFFSKINKIDKLLPARLI